MKIDWHLRHEPLAVEGCWAEGQAALELERKLLTRPGGGISAVRAGEQVVALGFNPPWVDGAVFLGRVDHLFLPNLWEPNIPMAWIVSSLTRFGPPPWVLLRCGRVVGLNQATVVP